MDALDREQKYFFHTYKRIPLEIEKGEGVYLISKDGKYYLDMFGGLAVNALGYGHRGLLDAIRIQSEKYIHLSNYYLQEPQINLAELLIRNSGYKRVFFTNSGTEAVEGALKIARKWGKGKNKSKILSFTNSFHGRTLGSLSLMDRPNYKDGFEPFLENFETIEYNNPSVLQKKINEKTLAIVLEFIQGEGGIQIAYDDFAKEIQNLKNKYGFLLIADEIQTGLGRTGKLFAFKHFEVEPDIVIIAKPLGGGLPLGAILGNEEVGETLKPGTHGTTFGGNPVACAAGIVFINEIIKNGIMENAKNMGERLKLRLLELKNKYPSQVKEVRGIGLMLGMELTYEGEPTVTAMRERGILINCTSQNVLRFLPPLIIKQEHIDKTVNELEEILKGDQGNRKE